MPGCTIAAAEYLTGYAGASETQDLTVVQAPALLSWEPGEFECGFPAGSDNKQFLLLDLGEFA